MKQVEKYYYCPKCKNIFNNKPYGSMECPIYQCDQDLIPFPKACLVIIKTIVKLMQSILSLDFVAPSGDPTRGIIRATLKMVCENHGKATCQVENYNRVMFEDKGMDWTCSYRVNGDNGEMIFEKKTKVKLESPEYTEAIVELHAILADPKLSALSTQFRKL